MFLHGFAKVNEEIPKAGNVIDAMATTQQAKQSTEEMSTKQIAYCRNIMGIYLQYSITVGTKGHY